MRDDEDRKRTLSQNRKLWPMLADFARQVPWMHTKGGQWQRGMMPPQSWKAVLTAGFEKETEMAQGIDGGSVMLGASTSNYGVRQFSEFIEYLYAIGSDKGVEWSEQSKATIAEVLNDKVRKAQRRKSQLDN